MPSTLNIAQICPETYALGPGKRFVVWVQGCPFDCAGCIAPEWIEIKEAARVEVGALAQAILSIRELEGITISGGEPMLQAEALGELICALRSEAPALSVIVFSGFTLTQLRAKCAEDRSLERLLNQIDVLIDGTYLGARNNGIGLRGSSNQRVHFLTGRYTHLKEEFEHGPRNVEIHVLNGELLLTGIPTPESLSAFEAAAKALRDSR